MVESSHHCHYNCSVLDKLQYPVWTCYLQLPPIFAVYALSLCVHTIFDVPLLPRPAGAAVEPAAHSSKHYASVASISHLAVGLHP